MRHYYKREDCEIDSTLHNANTITPDPALPSSNNSCEVTLLSLYALGLNIVRSILAKGWIFDDCAGVIWLDVSHPRHLLESRTVLCTREGRGELHFIYGLFLFP